MEDKPEPETTVLSYEEIHRIPDYHMLRKPIRNFEKAEENKTELREFIWGVVARIPLVLLLVIPLLFIFSPMIFREEGNSLAMSAHLSSVPNDYSHDQFVFIGLVLIGVAILIPWTLLLLSFENWAAEFLGK